MSPENVWSYCNKCRQKTAHTERHQVLNEHTRDDYSQWEETFRMLQCQGCRDVHIRVEYWDQDHDLDDSDFRYFPPRMHRNIPGWARRLPREWYSLMQEIYDALAANSYRLAVMGARTLIDLYLTETIENHGSFAARLDRLVQEGHLGKHQRETLTAALEAGSAAAHRGHKPNIESLNAVLDITEHLLHAYVLKDVGDALKSATPPRPKKPTNQ
ncbi:DUF4145 domain-containing protein [Pseudomonas aeruginosa]|uniref:DUF4145 domain-containing protein n=1 Tax=Pseudomonas aeruginosa TaxID=287 RepID=UPI00053E7D31|nr:DUF4145 domain-containing protein [Pseudomonas aeruginosa]MBG5699108.1 DUF4145 domain-containing protein [Pseudomonas aeruginosa]MCS8449190.1 DUF4145 domain-containing protein [Pseudomonas aeruginosa]RUD26351.1 DUF4145 domain-containing protein [Pseudomonas aeruginosa]TEG33262.1 DUF4145 domain-containing protein [Pseudomonas aeruginosa]HBO0016580.1 DUF4145 domain-containing protein [Pseudomonas aeruginosa]